MDKIGAIRLFGSKNPEEGQLNTGALKADAGTDNNKKKFNELIAAAYNGATGYVSPPASNIMGFGPAAEA